MDPQILFRQSWIASYGSFTTDTTACPATIVMQVRDMDGKIRFNLPLTENDLGADPGGDGLAPCQEEQF